MLVADPSRWRLLVVHCAAAPAAAACSIAVDAPPRAPSARRAPQDPVCPPRPPGQTASSRSTPRSPAAVCAVPIAPLWRGISAPRRRAPGTAPRASWARRTRSAMHGLAVGSSIITWIASAGSAGWVRTYGHQLQPGTSRQRVQLGRAQQRRRRSRSVGGKAEGSIAACTMDGMEMLGLMAVLRCRVLVLAVADDGIPPHPARAAYLGASHTCKHHHKAQGRMQSASIAYSWLACILTCTRRIIYRQTQSLTKQGPRKKEAAR